MTGLYSLANIKAAIFVSQRSREKAAHRGKVWREESYNLIPIRLNDPLFHCRHWRATVSLFTPVYTSQQWVFTASGGSLCHLRTTNCEKEPKSAPCDCCKMLHFLKALTLRTCVIWRQWLCPPPQDLILNPMPIIMKMWGQGPSLRLGAGGKLDHRPGAKKT